jgi:hypothetical protein
MPSIVHYEGGTMAVYNTLDEALAQAGHDEAHMGKRADEVRDGNNSKSAGRAELSAAAREAAKKERI